MNKFNAEPRADGRFGQENQACLASSTIGSKSKETSQYCKTVLQNAATTNDDMIYPCWISRGHRIFRSRLQTTSFASGGPHGCRRRFHRPEKCQILILKARSASMAAISAPTHGQLQHLSPEASHLLRDFVTSAACEQVWLSLTTNMNLRHVRV